MSDVFAGFVGDAISIQPGLYRVQVVNKSDGLKIDYFEIDVSDDGEVALAPSNVAISSIAFRDQTGTVFHIRPVPLRRAKLTLFDVASISDANGRVAVLPPLMRATNWSSDISKLRSISVTIKSRPADAEIWIDGQQLDLRTDATFVVPLDVSRPLSSVGVLVRKDGYVNQMLKLSSDERQQQISVTLEQQ